MNSAAAHAAFVVTVSAARIYWLLRHAQHARDINIHKLHHTLSEKIGLRSADFLHSGTHSSHTPDRLLYLYHLKRIFQLRHCLKPLR